MQGVEKMCGSLGMCFGKIQQRRAEVNGFVVGVSESEIGNKSSAAASLQRRPFLSLEKWKSQEGWILLIFLPHPGCLSL